MTQDDLNILDHLKWQAIGKGMDRYNANDLKGSGRWAKVAKHINQVIEAWQKAEVAEKQAGYAVE